MSDACMVTVRTADAVQTRFAGVGFHVSHHLHAVGKEHFEQVIGKRWRELNPSFARLTHMQGAGRDGLDTLAEQLLQLKRTGTEAYLATWDPEDAPEGPARAAYAKRIVDQLEYFIRERGASNVRHYCMTNELTLHRWADMVGDMPRFRDYHRHLFAELQRRRLDVRLLASDASPVENWHTIEWAAENMDDVTGIYGGHHYINSFSLDDPELYPWFLSKLKWGAGIARRRGKDFILGEFGCKQDGSVRDGIKMDVCIYFGTPQEPMVGIQMAEAVIAALNAGVYALGNWTFTDYPDEYRDDYVNKWGTFRWIGSDYSTRAHYYAYGLLTRFFRGPATVFAVGSGDPLVRAAAVRHHDAGTWSVVLLSRRDDDVRIDLAVDHGAPEAPLRKYVYDPEDVPFHPFGDLQQPEGKLALVDGRLSDELAAGTLVVYTTAYDERRPSAVRRLKVEARAEGGNYLTWRPNPEPGLCYYRIHGSAVPGFAPSVHNQVGTTVATDFTDREPAGACRYKVVAVDRSGNSGPS